MSVSLGEAFDCITLALLFALLMFLMLYLAASSEVKRVKGLWKE